LHRKKKRKEKYSSLNINWFWGRAFYHNRNLPLNSLLKAFPQTLNCKTIYETAKMLDIFEDMVSQTRLKSSPKLKWMFELS